MPVAGVRGARGEIIVMHWKLAPHTLCCYLIFSKAHPNRCPLIPEFLSVQYHRTTCPVVVSFFSFFSPCLKNLCINMFLNNACSRSKIWSEQYELLWARQLNELFSMVQNQEIITWYSLIFSSCLPLFLIKKQILQLVFFHCVEDYASCQYKLSHFDASSTHSPHVNHHV